MTSEQLQNARAERWRQASNPILTAEDARAWMDGIGFCLFLPRRAQFPVAAPSFVEAVAGAVAEAPGSEGLTREAREAATSLLHRLTADGAVLPLNLLGAAGVGASDQPDFLVTREAMPYVFSLIGGRNWKSGPGAKASPLVLEIWKQLDGGGAQTAAEIQTALGREVTEGAVLRGLMELWNGLRAIPVYGEDGTRWELTQARFAAEMTASQKVAQATALSALVSLYLEAAVAAAEEEIETFLSPLTARSKVREVVNGLSATRQLGLISVGAQPLVHVAGSLPEFAEEPVEIDLESRAAGFERKPGAPVFDRKAAGDSRNRGDRSRPRTGRDGGARKPYERGSRPAFERGRSGPDRDRGSRERTGPPRERTGPPRERTGFGGRAAGRPAGRFAGRSSGPGGAAPFRPKAEGERPYRAPFEGKREGGDRKPFGGERKSFGKKPFDKTARPFRPRSSEGGKPFDRDRKGGERSGGARSSFGGGGGKYPAKKFGSDGGKSGPKKFGASEGARPFRPRREEDAGGERRSGERGAGKFEGEKKFDGPKRFGGAKKFDRPKFDGAKKSGAPKKFGGAKFGERGGAGSGAGSFRPRSGSERPSFSGGFKRETPGEKRPFFRERPAKAGDGEARPREFRPRPGAEGAGAKREGGWKPKSAGGFSKTGKPGFKSGGRPAFKSAGKPGFKKAGFGGAGKSFGKGKPSFGKPGFGKPGAGRTGKPAFGKSKPGGFKAPFRKRKDEGSKNAE